MSKWPTVFLNNGRLMPILGLGTWKSGLGEVAQAVKDAIDAGYRHIDGAHVYQNEHEVGEGINAKINDGTVKRKDLFITSKLWCTMHRPDLVEPAIRTTLKNLSLAYTDMYLIHWPMAYKEEGELLPTTADGKTAFSDVDYLDTWKAMEALVDAGLTKSIGLSNFNAKQVDRVCGAARIQPATNQVECHPYLTQKRLAKHCADKKIVITAYSPLGSPDRSGAQDHNLMGDPRLKTIADKYKKTVAQILIRYQIDNGHVVIPKSVTKSRIVANSQVFDFQLSKADLAYIDSMNCNGRFCAMPMPGNETDQHYPFNEEF